MKHTLRSLVAARDAGIKLTWLTCYDYSFARVLSQSEVDLLLVGDSGGMVALGYLDTVPVTMSEMLSLCSAVRRGAPDKFIVGDMPKGSYEVCDQDAISNAMRFLKEAGVDAVKLEGGRSMASRIQAITQSGVSVFGHIGLTPQSVAAFGGYRVVGRGNEERHALLEDAIAVQEAGAVAVLLEAVPPSLSATVTQKLNIPVFGIGAGPHVDGQLLILHDLLGLFPDFRPKFAKCFVPDVIGEFVETISGPVRKSTENPPALPKDGFFELARLAAQAFVTETREGLFPSPDYSYSD